MRVFIAIEIPEDIKSKIFHKFETLEKKNLFKGRFVPKNNLHLTLKFLGEISEKKIEDIKNKLKEIKFNKFKVKTGKTGFFNSEKFIKVIWIELISEGDKLKELQKLVSAKFPEIISKYAEFSSHITTARVKSLTNKANKEKLIKEIKGMNLKDLSFDIDEFVLMKSEFIKEPRGVSYKVLERFKLE